MSTEPEDEGTLNYQIPDQNTTQTQAGNNSNTLPNEQRSVNVGSLGDFDETSSFSDSENNSVDASGSGRINSE